jgi:signal transduction histidine kinase
MTSTAEPAHPRVLAFDALDAATRAIAGLQPVDRVLQLIVDRVRPLVGASYAAMGIVDSRGRIEQFIVSGIDEETRRLLGEPPQGHGLLGVIVRENRTLRIPDISKHPDSYGFPAHHPPMHSLLGVPVVAAGRTVGNLYLTDKRGATEFSEDDQALVEAFAAHAGIAIENARLHEQLRGLTVMEERERIGRDIHDGIIQALYGIGLSLEDVPELMAEAEGEAEAAARVERAIDQIHVAIRDLRTFVFGLRPELVESSTLVGGLAALSEAFRHNTLIEPAVHWPKDMAEPPPEISAELLAIASEALSNIARHARASAVKIDLAREPGGYRLSVVDNGVGLNLVGGRQPGHHGFANMRDRALGLGGRLEVSATNGGGTTITVRVPDALTSETIGP